ncbi:MAG: flagellar biosynthesis protein FliQ [Phycisphaerae bacterium]
MTISQAMDLARHTMMLVIQVSAPILVIGMVVGLIISLLQAVTQLQEQTISFVPKMIAMAVAAVIFLPWISTRLLDFAYAMFSFKSTAG